MNRRIDEAIKFLLIEFIDNKINETDNQEARKRWELWRQKIIKINSLDFLKPNNDYYKNKYINLFDYFNNKFPDKLARYMINK